MCPDLSLCSSVWCHYCRWTALAVRTYAYVTSSDVRNIHDFDEQTVVAIKAPSQTKLEISDPDEVVPIVSSVNRMRIICIVWWTRVPPAWPRAPIFRAQRLTEHWITGWESVPAAHAHLMLQISNFHRKLSIFAIRNAALISKCNTNCLTSELRRDLLGKLTALRQTT